MTVNWNSITRIDGEILIVEDDPTLRDLTQQIVQETGAKTVAFETADEALVYLLQSDLSCCLVIVDYGVPGQINGMDFIRMVRHKWPSTKTLLMSGYELMPGTVPSPTLYLQKPWSAEALLTSIAQLLQADSPVDKL
ncbi:Blue-light-activated protein [compost metagenome]